jgi:hypothetical protein
MGPTPFRERRRMDPSSSGSVSEMPADQPAGVSWKPVPQVVNGQPDSPGEFARVDPEKRRSRPSDERHPRVRHHEWNATLRE